MTVEISRRQALTGLAAGAGAAVFGWSPRTQAWVTDPTAAPDVRRLPRLDGPMTVDTTGFTEDFGRLVHEQPKAVLHPGSVDDIVRSVRYARWNRLKVAMNGQSGSGDHRESHSQYGQALVQGGIAVDPKPLATIHDIGDGYADVDAGVTWGTLATAALDTGQTPPVMNDFAHLSIGGTLSVGGLGGTSQHYGLQGDNVKKLEVVTGRGERVVCSRWRNRDLFDAVLAGGGQYGLIVRATVELVPAPRTALPIEIFYDDAETFLRDSLAIMRSGVASDQNSYIVPKDGGGWQYQIALATFQTQPGTGDHDAIRRLLSDGGRPQPGPEMPFSDWLFRFEPAWQQLREAGFWAAQKPWLSVMVPARNALRFLNTVVSELTVDDLGMGSARFSPMNADVIHRPTFMLPRGRQSELFEMTLARFPTPRHPDIAGLLDQNRRFYDHAVELGGTRYLIGAIPDMSSADWRHHYWRHWSRLLRAKWQYDPHRILTPGQGIFG